MGSLVIDPGAHVPPGFELEPRRPGRRVQQEVFIADWYKVQNEDLAIVNVRPRIEEGFDCLESLLRKFFTGVHQVRVIKIQPCALGDAYVRFESSLEREMFLGPEFQFENYTLSVCKHDRGINARVFDFNRQAWFMLVGFPEDLRNDAGLARGVSTFGILVDWDKKSKNLARVIVKVYVKPGIEIPDTVIVDAGVPVHGRSWIVDVFLLKKKATTASGASTQLNIGSDTNAEELGNMFQKDPIVKQSGGDLIGSSNPFRGSGPDFTNYSFNEPSEQIQMGDQQEMNVNPERSVILLGFPSHSGAQLAMKENTSMIIQGDGSNARDKGKRTRANEHVESMHGLNSPHSSPIQMAATDEETDDVVEIARPVFTRRKKRRSKKHREAIPVQFLRRSPRFASKEQSATASASAELNPLAIIAAPTIDNDDEGSSSGGKSMLDA